VPAIDLALIKALLYGVLGEGMSSGLGLGPDDEAPLVSEKKRIRIAR
jgi:hypothetical protein